MSYIIRLTNQLLEARRNGDLIQAKILEDKLALVQYIL